MITRFLTNFVQLSDHKNGSEQSKTYMYHLNTCTLNNKEGKSLDNLNRDNWAQKDMCYLHLKYNVFNIVCPQEVMWGLTISLSNNSIIAKVANMRSSVKVNRIPHNADLNMKLESHSLLLNYYIPQ